MIGYRVICQDGALDARWLLVDETGAAWLVFASHAEAVAVAAAWNAADRA